MRTSLVLLAVALAGAAALPVVAHGEETPVRDCGTRAYGDLGRGWQERAVVAGPLAFVGLGRGLDGVQPSPRWAAWPRKVLVVVEPARTATLTIAAGSRSFAALGYHGLRHSAEPVPLSEGTPSIRFAACAPPSASASWNRGTQFPGYLLVSGRRCVAVEIASRGKVYRRTLRIGAARC